MNGTYPFFLARIPWLLPSRRIHQLNFPGTKERQWLTDTMNDLGDPKLLTPC
jgi:hypothetical protein